MFLAAVMVLIGSGAAAAIKALAPSESTARYPAISIDEIHQQVDVKSLPTLEVKDPL
jgi:hypothetical protein